MEINYIAAMEWGGSKHPKGCLFLENLELNRVAIIFCNR